MILVKNAYLIDPRYNKEGYYDILIEENKIVQIGKEVLCEKARIIDAEGCIAAPGLVDVHVHFRDPGFTHKEDIISGAKAAAAGGFTTVVLMANTKPCVDTTETLTYILEKGKKTGIHVETCATVSMGMKGEAIVPMEELKQAGASGFTDDGIPLMNEKILRDAMLLAKKCEMPISLHEENPVLIKNNGINSEAAKEYFGVDGSPKEAEISLVERDLQIALETGAVLNIQHISTKEAVELVRQAKKKGSNIHAEATPHHFTLTQEAVKEHGTLAKMNPPLRGLEDKRAIIAGLLDGTIDIIATDHAPHSKEEKEKPITEAPSGIIGLETALSLGITQLVEKEGFTWMQLLEKMTWNPARMYRLDAGYLAEGGPADLVIFNPKKEKIAGSFFSKSKNTPFTGKKLKGVVEYTICSGNIVYENKGESK